VKDEQIIEQITTLVDEEHRLRTRRQHSEIDSDEESARLRALEESLDQCWDLLRRRRAAREFGTDPEQAETQSPSQVEGYLQ
jgi:hypothetical protein